MNKESLSDKFPKNDAFSTFLLSASSSAVFVAIFFISYDKGHTLSDLDKIAIHTINIFNPIMLIFLFERNRMSIKSNAIDSFSIFYIVFTLISCFGIIVISKIVSTQGFRFFLYTDTIIIFILLALLLRKIHQEHKAYHYKYLYGLTKTEEFWNWALDKNYLKTLFKEETLRYKLYQTDNMISLTDDRNFWKVAHQNVRFDDNIKAADCFENKEFNNKIIETYKKRGGLFLSDQGSLGNRFPTWDISFCHKTKRLLFSMDSYFDIINETGIVSALTVVSAETEPLPLNNQTKFFGKILEHGGYVGFIVYGEETNTEEPNLKSYNDVLAISIKKAKDTGKEFDEKNAILIHLPKAKLFFNTGFLCIKNNNNGKKIISIDGLLNKANESEVVVTKPQNFTDKELKRLSETIEDDDSISDEAKEWFSNSGFK